VSTTPVLRPAPAVITDATWGDALRSFQALDFDDPARGPLRERIVTHLFGKTGEVIDRADYDEVVEHLATVTTLYTPEEIAEGALPPGIETVARYLADKGTPRSDEARVLSAYLVLGLLHPDDPAPRAEYERVRKWGFEVRATLKPEVERFDEGLLDAWEEHARLTPTPRVLKTLSRLYVERRDATVALLATPERDMSLNPASFQSVQRTVLSVAALYLRHGDVASAQSHVRALGSAGGIEERLLALLQTAREDSSEGAGALLDLGRAYQELGRLDVARALCLTGLRAHREDARFPQCLARVAADENDYGGAMAWYGESVRMAPDERALYDEILEVLNHLIEQGLFSSDVTETRKIGARAIEILDERVRRWPDTPPPIRPEELLLAIAMAEMNAGNAGEAEDLLKRSLAKRETIEALLQLALLLDRVGRGREATRLCERALNLTTADGEDRPRRAEVLERLGDTLRGLGDESAAGRRYAEGLAWWDQNLARLKGRRVGLAQLRRGVLLGRLARAPDSIGAFERAMQLAPGLRETYATILAYLVVSKPDVGFAHRVFRHALNQLSLEPEWKVYFALWLKTIAGRGGTRTDLDVDGVLADLSVGDDWWAKLARFASGKLDYDALLAQATGTGERTEAIFYEGARRLGAGDVEGARAMFQTVLDTHMVNFYEFAMAQELMTATTAATSTPGTNAVTPSSPK
jgi:tetratricopeptide (TPR) repeat protein